MEPGFAASCARKNPGTLLSNTLPLAEARKIKLASDKSQSMKVQIAFD
ncbi:hypothetical protein LB515_23380 [Mesorhizobium sp. CA15]|nr:hypothetical protein [Mesorhizobium sp. CA15]MBZ9868328.1 hypothetical protein [Mesorhizobium sp. CA15]